MQNKEQGQLGHLTEPTGAAGSVEKPTDPSSQASSGDVIGPFRVEERLGEGGMGQVYRATRTDDLHLQVAIKTLSHWPPKMMDLFRAECKILSGLKHPGIAHLIDVGTTDTGQPWMAMEYVPGKTLNKYLADHKLTLKARLALFLQICDALSHAHHQMIIHRDLKPSNIMITADDRVKLLDFGIASALDPQTGEQELVTLQAERMMTPEYASPEQINGGRLSAASDVYSLGILLFEMLVGQRPYSFQNRMPQEVSKYVNNVVIPRPSSLLQKQGKTQSISPQELRGDLDTILLKALAQDLSQRYPSVETLSGDLRLYMLGLPINARPASPGYLLGKWVRRNPLPLALTSALIVFLLTFAIYAKIQQERIARERDYAQAKEQHAVAAEKSANESRRLALAAEEKAQRNANEARQYAEKIERKTLENNYSLAFGFNEKAGQALAEGKPQEAWLASLTALSLEIPPDKQLPQSVGRFLDERMAGIENILWTAPATPALSAICSDPSGTHLALAGEDTLVRLMDPATGIQEALLDDNDLVLNELRISPDGMWLAGASEADTVALWHLETRKYQALAGHHGRVATIAFSPDSTYLASADDGGEIIVRQLSNLKPFIRTSLNRIKGLSFGPDNACLYIACERGILGLPLEGGRLMEVCTDGPATALAWQQGLGLLSGWPDGSIRVHLGTNIKVAGKHQGPVRSIATQAIGQLLMTTDGHSAMSWTLKDDLLQGKTQPEFAYLLSLDLNRKGELNARDQQGALRRYQFRQQRPLPSMVGTYGDIFAIALSPDGHRLAVGFKNGDICLWDLEGKSGPYSWHAHQGLIRSLEFSPDGQFLASAPDDLTVIVWKLNPLKIGKAKHLSLPHPDRVGSVSFSPKGTLLATATRSGKIYIWELTNPPTQNQVINTGFGKIDSVLFSPDGRQIAMTSYDQPICIWNLSPGRMGSKPTLIPRTRGSYKSIDFSSDGKFLLSTSQDKTARTWDLADLDQQDAHFTLEHKTYPIGGVFSDDMRHIATMTTNGTLNLWIDEGKVKTPTFVALNQVTHSLRKSKDDRLLASSGDGTYCLLNFERLRKPQMSQVLKGHTDGVIAVAFSADGSKLASGSADETVRIWDRKTKEATLFAKESLTLHGHHGMVTDVCFSPNGRFLASCSWDRTLCIWDLSLDPITHPTPLQTLPGKDIFQGIAFSPDGTKLAASGPDFTLVWNTSQLARSAKLDKPSTLPGGYMGITFSPDSKLLAVAQQDFSILLWDAKAPGFARSGRKAQRLKGHASQPCGIAFSPDGKILASASRDRTIRIWDVATARLRRVLRGHQDYVYGVGFSPKGDLLASTSADRTTRLWRVSDGTPLAVLQGHTGEVNWYPAFSEDGRFLATPSDDMTIRIWPMNNLLLPPPGTEGRIFYAELLKRSLYLMGYRRDGFNFRKQPHIRLYGGSEVLVSHPNDHLDRPRPAEVSILDWLLK